LRSTSVLDQSLVLDSGLSPEFGLRPELRPKLKRSFIFALCRY